MKILPVLLGSVMSATMAHGNSLQEGPRIIAPAERSVGWLVPDLEFQPISGAPFRLRRMAAHRAVVIAFTSTSCPVSKRYAPTLAALEQEYAPRGVRFVFVNPVPSDSADAINEAIRTHRFAGPYVHDKTKRISSLLAAASTTEVFVIDKASTLIYRGAIDDQYGLGYSLDAPKQRFLAKALDALLDSRHPAVRATSPPGCELETAQASAAIAAPLTYHARVSRIVQQHCLECHRDGGIAPFSLERYDDVTSHAGMIRKQIEREAMPPWFAAPQHPSPWANDRTLPARDKADLLAWLKSERAEGDPADAPVSLALPKEWQIGEPDAVVRIPEAYEVKPSGTLPYHNVYVQTNFGEDRWVQAMEVRPTAREVVHHALVHVITQEDLPKIRQRGRDRGGGDFFAAYVPGNAMRNFPDGFAKLIPAGATLHFQIHYTPNGTVAHDQTQLGLIFAKEPPRHEVRVAAISARLDIPPGAENHEVRGSVPVPFDAKLLSFMPHMHVRGKGYRYELKLPSGEQRALLEVPRYDFNWQLQYRLAQPVDAPAGSSMLGTAWYDNSAKNPANPDPTKRVRWGEQTDDEMMLGYFEYYVPSLSPGAKASSLVEMALRDGGLIFNRLDKNRDEKITIDESPSAASFEQADANKDGEVTRDEFKIFWQQQKRERPAPE